MGEQYFGEFCNSLEVTDEERVLLAFHLAAFRQRRTIGALLVDYQEEMLLHLTGLRGKQV